MAFRYQQFLPTGGMARFVDACWINQPDADRPHTASLTDHVLPDGCIDLVFRGQRDRGSGSRLFVSALITRPDVIQPDPDAFYVGVRFRPGMARVVTGLDPCESRDRSIGAGEIGTGLSLLEQRLVACDSPSRALGVLYDYASRTVRDNEHRAASPCVLSAVAMLSKTAGALRVRDLADRLGVSERSLHREVVSATGLSPKTLARIFRMHRAVASIRSGPTPLLQLAHDAGYADQPHMIREVLSLTGFTPSQIRTM